MRKMIGNATMKFQTSKHILCVKRFASRKRNNIDTNQSWAWIVSIRGLVGFGGITVSYF